MASDDCDEDTSETTFASPNESIFPTTVLSGNSNGHPNEPTQYSSDLDSSSLRKPRSEQTDAIIPTGVQTFDSTQTSSAISEERQNNAPNADIQDIITGIVKLLNGNVNLQANTQYAPPTTLRRFATRINNRGPPRIPEYPVVLPVENIKTTPYPSGIRKPPTVPYPFDLPPPPVEKPMRAEHTVIMHNNKPIQPNRPPWHGSRTRPPIQITNTNPNRMPSRLPPQPSQDLRPPSKTVNPMTTYSTRLPDLIKSSDIYSSEESMSTLQPSLQTEPMPPKEMTSKKSDVNPKKATKLPSSTSSTIIESMDLPKFSVNLQTSMSSLETLDRTTQTTHLVTHLPQKSATLEESIQMPQFIPSTTQTTQHIVTEIQTTETLESSIENTEISPSRVTKPSEQIESTDFKSFYARPGIVLDDTDFKPGAHVLEPSTEPAVLFHQTHRNPNVQSSASLSNIFAEIFDVTLSAIQGQPGTHHKVVDLFEYGHPGSDAPDIIATKYGTDGNDIIVSASDDNSFVSIDGKRTYINLFGETAETEHLKNPLKTQNDHRVYQQSTKTVIYVNIISVLLYQHEST